MANNNEPRQPETPSGPKVQEDQKHPEPARRDDSKNPPAGKPK
jgi:hypothetical protein